MPYKIGDANRAIRAAARKCSGGSLTPAVSAYQGEFRFTGTIRRVTVDVAPADATPPPDAAAID